MLKTFTTRFLGVSLPLLLVGCGGLIPFPMVETVPIPPATGRIITEHNGTPITGAKIVVRGHPETATTSDAAGRFTTIETTGRQFSLFSSGYESQDHVLLVTHNGFLETRLRWTRPALIGQRRHDCPPIQVHDIVLTRIQAH